MFTEGGAFLAPVLSTVTVLLALSIVVQVLQEVYKFVTSSKSTAFQNFLVDYLGPWAAQVFDSTSPLDLKIRGPFQFLRLRPAGKLLPLNPDSLANTLEETASAWHKHALEALRLEVKLQAGHPKRPSPAWIAFRRQLDEAEPGTMGYPEAAEIKQFIDTWREGYGHPEEDWESFDAASLLVAYRAKFLAHIDRVVSDYPQLKTNFDYAYRRRNLRQTVILGFIVALRFGLPIDAVYDDAKSQSLESALAAADKALAIYEGYERATTGDTTSSAPDDALAIFKEQIGSASDLLRNKATAGCAGQTDMTQAEGKTLTDAVLGTALGPTIVCEWDSKGAGGSAAYIFWCLVTAILVSFGAPFWNDILGIVAAKAKSNTRKDEPDTQGQDERG